MRSRATEREPEGLSDRVEYIEDDYRAISGKFDVFVSVGMLEHVGLDHFQEFSEIIHRSIGDTGRGLLHFIGRNYPAVFSRWIRKHIFPGGICSVAAAVAEGSGAEELFGSGRGESADALRQDAGALAGALREAPGSRWRRCTIPASCARGGCIWRDRIAAFRGGHLQLFQILFTGSEREPIFWTRDPLYCDAQPVEDTEPVVEKVREKVKWTHAMS